MKDEMGTQVAAQQPNYRVTDRKEKSLFVARNYPLLSG